MVPPALSLILPWLLGALAGDARAGDVVLLDQSDTVEEDRFHEELALSMDGVLLREGTADFFRETLADQLTAVRPILAESETSAVAWLDVSDPTLLRVSVAFVEADRAIVRLLDVPREAGAEARLALATRELLAAVYAEEVGLEPQADIPSHPVEPTPPAYWSTGFAAGVVAPLSAEAGGIRGSLSAHVEREVGPWFLGGGLETQLGLAQWRLGPTVMVRRGVAFAGARADWTQLAWTEQLQPRLFMGLRWSGDAGFWGEARATLAPVRDEVVRGDTLLYNSGWGEFSISYGWSRKIGGS